MRHFFSRQSIQRLVGREQHTDGMIALVPTEADAARLALPGWEPADILHVTLAFLADGWTAEDMEIIRDVGEAIANSFFGGPMFGDAWAAGSFNPTGPKPCAAYLVEGEDLTHANEVTVATMGNIASSLSQPVPRPHSPWVPHITIGYGLDVHELTEFGPVTFDRLRVAFGEANATDFKLGG